MRTICVSAMLLVLATTVVACDDDAAVQSDAAVSSGSLEIRIETPELNPDQPHKVSVVADPAIDVTDAETAWNVVRYEDVPVGEYELTVSLADSSWTGSATVEVRNGETTSKAVAVE